MHEIFISYSHKDKAVADAICARLESGNIRCWYAPRDIAPGADWAASIIDAIKEAKIMVLIFTDFSNASKQVLREVNNAVSAGIPIVPFKLTDADPTKGMQYYLSTVHWLDAMTLPLERSVTKLHELIYAMLTGAAVPAGPSQPVETPKKKWLIPVIAGAAAVVIAAGVGIFFATRGSAPDAADEEKDQTPAYVDTVELATEASLSLEVLTPPEGTIEGVSDINNTGTQGNIQSNYQNEGLATSDGQWFYFQGNDHQSLYRMRLDGSGKSKINSMTTKSIGVYEGYIYYQSSSSNRGIWRIRPDGTDAFQLFSGASEDMMLIDGRIFFRNGSDNLCLYSMALDGTDRKKESSLTELYEMAIWDGRVYWQNQDDGSKLYSANFDGSDKQCLSDARVSGVTVVDGCVFYNAEDEFYMYTIETQQTTRLFSFRADNFIVSEYGIFLQDGNHRLYRAELGGHQVKQITDTEIRYFSVCAGYIFYRDADTGKMYMMKYDGTGDTML